MKPQTIRIWGDTAKVRPSTTCRHRACAKPLWFVLTVKSSKQIPLDQEPVALRTSTDPDTGKQIWEIDSSIVHFANCPGAAGFRRDR